MKKRSEEGLGSASRRRAEPISSLEENILWERTVIGSDNPSKLLDTMVFLNGIHFALRGGTEHRHRSNAVRSYKRTENFQQNESSEILYGKKQKTTTCTETKLQLEEEKTSHDSSHQVVNIESVRRESVAEPTTLTFKPVSDKYTDAENDRYAVSQEGTYDYSGSNRRHELEDNIYNHAVDNVYDSRSHKRTNEGKDDTYDHFFGQKTEDDYDIPRKT
ncbi:unnamed protein product [Mytilus coruscus]|uniref:ZMYM2-like/QRICH1 C-terminal domain-containing protein n=1 Tax=Mytilus coruscus TaxID=42192 RepID=A0A6J7ZTV3_MYTCO|nr:unnamed protein product [Mytilus coruscus]